MTITSNQTPNEQRHFYLELLVGSETARNIQIDKQLRHVLFLNDINIYTHDVHTLNKTHYYFTITNINTFMRLFLLWFCTYVI